MIPRGRAGSAFPRAETRENPPTLPPGHWCILNPNPFLPARMTTNPCPFLPPRITPNSCPFLLSARGSREEPSHQGSRGRARSRFLIPTFPVPRMLFPLLIGALGLASAMEIQVPEEPVVALFGHDATLHCSFSPEANFSVAELSLIWQLTDTKSLVHGFSGGRDRLQDQGRGYANRTSLFYDQLAQGNVSLLLRRVEISDEGSFTCFVRVRDYDSAAVMLQVAAPYSKPSVHLEPSKDLKPGDVAVVTCHASHGYPQASVLWQDSRGANLTSNVTTSQVANEEGLFEVHSVLHVLVEPSVTYSCLVLNAVLQQHGHASVTITAPGIPGGGPVGDSGPGCVCGGAARRPGLRVPPENPRELPRG
ncbi:CD276 antigen isoform X3 [Catharus ustulatus]|uniref:CD276 antigen isoform X3 n=1 Tax=Catharus ustulatus TaxID=91951 RepID=UPI00140BC115|nr:CD276 antigen isoform X3 [Catharus ustulatus]